MKDNQSSSNHFLIQGSILAAAGIIVRLIGLLYKIPMTRILGPEGIGYYNTAYEIYNIGLILSSYSLPLAISKLIAVRRARGQYQDACRVFLAGIGFGVLAGGIMTLVLFLEADWITTYIFNSPGSALPLKVMAPTIFVFSIMGVIRGSFQGQGNMLPTSISQIIEQIVNAIVSVAASFLFMKWYASTTIPASYGAAGGTLGTLSGALAALAVLLIILFRKRTQQMAVLKEPSPIRPESCGHVISVLLLTLIPIILSQFVYQLSGVVDNSMFGLIMGAKGFSEKERMSLLGVYGGEYRLLSNVPVAIASALGTSMIPSIVTSRMNRNTKEVTEKIHLTIKFNMLIAIPCAVGLAVLASPVMRLVFGDSQKLSADLMRIGSLAVVFFSLSTVTNSVLQGVDLMGKAVAHSAISLGIHTGLVFIMLSILDWSVYGLVIGNVTFALVICILNWISMKKTLKYHQEVKTTFLLPFAASALMGMVSYLVYTGSYVLFQSNTLALLIAIPVAMAVYGFFLLLLRAVSQEELRHMPLGTRFIRLGKKLRLM